MSSTETQRAEYRRAQWLRIQILTNKYARVREVLVTEVDRIEEELWAAYAHYAAEIYPFDPLPFDCWIQPPPANPAEQSL